MDTVEFNYQQLFLKDSRSIFFSSLFSDFVQIFSQLSTHKMMKCESSANQKRTHFASWLTVFWQTLRFDGLACGVRSLVLVSGLEATLMPKTQLIFIKSYFNLFLEMLFPNLQVQQGRNFIFMSLVSLKVDFTSRAVISLKWVRSSDNFQGLVRFFLSRQVPYIKSTFFFWKKKVPLVRVTLQTSWADKVSRHSTYKIPVSLASHKLA